MVEGLFVERFRKNREIEETQVMASAASLALLCNKREEVLVFQKELLRRRCSERNWKSRRAGRTGATACQGQCGCSIQEGLHVVLRFQLPSVLHDALEGVG